MDPKQEDSGMDTQPKVLIIEDDKDLVNAMQVIFESRHLSVRTAFNGKDGWAAIQAQKPDVIILDVMMATPTEGIDLAKRLKHRSAYRMIPIVMVTGFPQEMAAMGPEKFVNALGEDWPAAMFIEKPVDLEKLAQTVETILNESQPAV
jgi:DNA-binding NtrC family response regulator